MSLLTKIRSSGLTLKAIARHTGISERELVRMQAGQRPEPNELRVLHDKLVRAELIQPDYEIKRYTITGSTQSTYQPRQVIWAD